MSPLFSLFGKKNKDDLSSPLLDKRIFLGKGANLGSLNLKNGSTLTPEDVKTLIIPTLRKVYDQANHNAKINGGKNHVITFAKVQLGNKEKELIRRNMNSGKKTTTRSISKVKHFGPRDSLISLKSKTSCEQRRARKIMSFSSMVSTSSSTTVTVTKERSRIVSNSRDYSRYNSILRSSVPIEIINSNCNNPVNCIPVRRVRKVNRDPISPIDHSTIKPEVITDLEAKTKVIPVIMQRIASIENELSGISKTTREIKEVDSGQNLVKASPTKSNHLSDTSILDRRRIRKTKTLAAKKKKCVKGKRRKTRTQSMSGTFVTPIKSEPSKLNFVFEPKTLEFSSYGSSAPKQTCKNEPHHASSVVVPTSAPKPDEKIDVSQSDYNRSENPLESFLKSFAFASVIGGKVIGPFFPNNIPLVCTTGAGELNSISETQNQLSSAGNSVATQSTGGIVRQQVKKDGALKDEDKNDLSLQIPPSSENYQECLSSHKPIITQDKRDNDVLRLRDEVSETQAKLDTNDTVDDVKPSHNPRENYESAEDNTLKPLGCCKNHEKDSELFIRNTQLRDRNSRNLNFENLSPTLIESTREDCIVKGDYVSVTGGPKAQPYNARSILTSFDAIYTNYEKEEFPTTDSVNTRPRFVFDSAGDGDIMNATTEENLRYLDREKITFFEVEKDFVLEDCSRYLDRNRRKSHDEEIRSIILCSNMTLLPSRNVVHFVTNDLGGDSVPERNILKDYKFDYNNIYSECESSTKMFDNVCEDTSESNSEKRIGDIQKMTPHSGFCVVLEEHCEEEKSEVDLKVQESFEHKLIEDIVEALEDFEAEVSVVEERLTKTVEVQTDDHLSRTVELDLSSLSSLIVKNVNKLYVEGSQTEDKKVNVATQTETDTLSEGCQVENENISSGNQVQDEDLVVGCQKSKEVNRHQCDNDLETYSMPLTDLKKIDDGPLNKHFCRHFCFSHADEILCSDIDMERDSELFHD